MTPVLLTWIIHGKQGKGARQVAGRLCRLTLGSGTPHEDGNGGKNGRKLPASPRAGPEAPPDNYSGLTVANTFCNNWLA